MGTLTRVKWCLVGCVVSLLVVAGASILAPGRSTDALNWMASKDFARKLRPLEQPEPAKNHHRIEMNVVGVLVSQIESQPVVMLKEKDAERYLPISIGPAEANAIAVMLDGVEVPRPLTPDLLCP